MTAPVIDRGWADVHLNNSALDVHRDDRVFGYGFIADDLKGWGLAVCENRVALLWNSQRTWSVFAKERGLMLKAGPPIHDEPANPNFTATAPSRL